jgi:hypothetical protein
MTGMKIWIAVFLTVLALPACRDERQSCSSTATGKTGAAPILGIHHVPSLTQERYEAVVRKITNGKDRLASMSDGGIEGLLVHVTGQGDDGFWIVDVFESQEAVDRFRQMIKPIAVEAGITEPLKTMPVHTFLAC